MAANLIADNIFVSIDEEVHRNMLLGSIDDSLTSGESFREKMHFYSFTMVQYIVMRQLKGGRS